METAPSDAAGSEPNAPCAARPAWNRVRACLYVAPLRLHISAMERTLLAASGALGFLAVAFGAFGAHGLEKRLASLPDFADRMRWWQTGAHYHLVHALAVGLVAFAVGRGLTGPVPGYLFGAGIVLFSGSLYVMTLTGVRALGAVTPLGGLCMLAGWAMLAVSALRAG